MQRVADAPEDGLSRLALLERYGGTRTKQAVAGIAAGQMMWPMVKTAWRTVRRREDYTITVPGTDDLYADLHEWVLERIPVEERKAMIADTQIADFDGEESAVRLRYDGSRVQKVTIERHKIDVAVTRDEMPNRSNLPDNWRRELERITFAAKTVGGRDAVLDVLRQVLADKGNDPKPPALFMPARWGPEWVKRADLPVRSLDSVILKDEQLEGLVNDLGGFLAAEEEYNRFSQPWHRGYIFHGVPGTGKTSVARALANHFKLNTYYLPLRDIEKDSSLLQYVAAIQPRSVLLLEDVDVYNAARERTDENDEASIAAMLNALDGVWTPHGLITIMTTNNRDALDEALVRAGRIDVEEEFTDLDWGQATRIATYFGEEATFPAKAWIGRSPADLIEHLKQRRLSCAAR